MLFSSLFFWIEPILASFFAAQKVLVRELKRRSNARKHSLQIRHMCVHFSKNTAFWATVQRKDGEKLTIKNFQFSYIPYYFSFCIEFVILRKEK